MSNNEFVQTLSDIWKSNDRKICFVLGAGASKTSGIRTGAELAREWLAEIEKRMKDQPSKYTTFLSEKKIDLDNVGQGYGEIYKERFRFDKDSGYDFINKELEKATPGYGYSVLAQVLSEKQHNVVITTNFDNLTEEALYTYSSKRPLICGHESLAAFAKPSASRPLIIKIHRDRFLEPKSNQDDISQLSQSWVSSLNNIFSSSTPVFIGYGGNDGSLMDYLHGINQINNMFWCERKGVDIPQKVVDLLEKNNGKLVRIDGFDELMFSLQDGLGLKLLDKEMIDIAETRSKSYLTTVLKIRGELAKSGDAETRGAVGRTAEKIGDKDANSWFAWELKAQDAKTFEEKEKIYQEGILQLPESADLIGNYGVILYFANKKQEAEQKYLAALQIDPKNKQVINNYGNLLSENENRRDEANAYYLNAIQNDPANTDLISGYSYFLDTKMGAPKDAARYYLQAIELNPANGIYSHSYAISLELQEDYDTAKRYYLQALDLSPNNASLLGDYGNFLENYTSDENGAELYFRRALDINEEDGPNNARLALFLWSTKKDFINADKYFLKSISVDPDHPIFNSNYAGYLLCQGKKDTARPYLDKATAACKNDILRSEILFYEYAHYDKDRAAKLQELKELICDKKIRSNNFNLDLNVEAARKDNHPEPTLVQELADIITKKKDPTHFCMRT